MTYGEAQRYWIWLSSIPGLSAKSFEQLLEEYGEPQYVWEQLILARRVLNPRAFEHLKKARSDEYMEKLFRKMEEDDIVAVTQLDDAYPDRLRGIDGAPHTLYVRGNTELNDEKMFAIVGSRKITQDGRHFTETVAGDLAEMGVIVVSGLAAGADGRAHEGCLLAGGKTIAVMGTGPDKIYPPEHKDLAERILLSGGSLISEYPPGTPPNSWNFPQRNRIISGMSDGVMMTEGTLKSGAMITIRFAREQRRPCFAVPGSVYSQASEGPNQMLVDGDIPAISARQVLSYFGWGMPQEEKAGEDPLLELDETSKNLVEMLRFEEKSFDELAFAMKMDSSALNSLLTILEMQGIIRQSAGKMYRAIV